jgi:hypothetical protein
MASQTSPSISASEAGATIIAPTKAILDARISASNLISKYSEDPRQNKLRLLLTGESGSGKTHILRTARRPVHIDSFDPDGTIPLRDLIAKGDVIPDAVYENEDREKPEMFSLWVRTFNERVRSKYFESIGTYCLDSSTLWADAIMNHIMGKEGRAGEAPRFTKDYVPQKVAIQNCMRRILNLPCDVIVTGHLKGEYDTRTIDGEEVKILTGMRYLTTGQGTVIIPLLFSELYTCLATAQGNSTKYQLLTAKHGPYLAKTRIGRGVFDTYEEPDIRKLLTKAGWDTKDKERLLG